jgi:hypothetical protein
MPTKSNKSKAKKSVPGGAVTHTVTLADLLSSLQHDTSLSATRSRDLQSAVKRVASLLGEETGAIPLDLPAISAKLAAINPVAKGLTSKTFSNIRSNFLTSVSVSGLKAVQRSKKTELSPAWVNLMAQHAGERAQLGLSRLAHYASAKGIEPDQVTDAAIEGFIAAVREGSLHRKPNDLHRQVTVIWNEVAKHSGFKPVTVAAGSKSSVVARTPLIAILPKHSSRLVASGSN